MAAWTTDASADQDLNMQDHPTWDPSYAAYAGFLGCLSGLSQSLKGLSEQFPPFPGLSRRPHTASTAWTHGSSSWVTRTIRMYAPNCATQHNFSVLLVTAWLLGHSTDHLIGIRMDSLSIPTSCCKPHIAAGPLLPPPHHLPARTELLSSLE